MNLLAQLIGGGVLVALMLLGARWLYERDQRRKQYRLPQNEENSRVVP